MASTDNATEYVYRDGSAGHTLAYLLPVLRKLIQEHRPCRAFDLGCGNGAVSAWMQSQGLDIVGVDASVSGIAMAREYSPSVRFEVGSAYDDLASLYGQFPFVVSLEVVEHLFDPRSFAKTVYNLLQPGGVAVISTPYHGYFKNLALALSGRLDAHFTALWVGGHIKFWSIATLSRLLAEAGLTNIRFVRAGRIPMLAKSMIAIAERPRG